MSGSAVLTITTDLLSTWGRDPFNLLQILHGLQRELGHIPEESVTLIAEQLAIAPARINSVIAFYSFLRSDPSADYRILFSDNITDRMLGSRQLGARLARRFPQESAVDDSPGIASIGYTSCTGVGDQGPAALINGQAISHLSADRVDQIAALIEHKIPLTGWPASFFAINSNIRRRDLLLDNALGAGAALRQVLERGAERILDELDQSGLRGRGGAGFNTAMKWRFCRGAPGGERYVVCNADEGEPGTFKDRALLQDYADRLVEGMTLCAAIVGAAKGFIYLRAEYAYLQHHLQAELARRREVNLLGDGILGQKEFGFDIEIHLGAGAYICGEESALIESLEGKRGIPRVRPPFPVTRGYRGKPTVVNNVETLVAAAMIAAHGADWFRSRGTAESPGSKILSISGDCQQPGVYEYPFGVSIESILADCGARDVQAVQVAGPAGHCVPPAEFTRRIAFEDLSTGGSFMVFNNSRDLLDVVGNFADFFVHESCGFCTPCRVGTSLIRKRLQKVQNSHATGEDLKTLSDIAALMRSTSHCGLGQTAANPLVDTMAKFPLIYESRLKSTLFEPAFDLDGALEEARQITGRHDAAAHIEGGGV